MSNECPILTATKQGKNVSGNPCQSCGFYGDCLDDLERDMGEEILRITGAYIRAVKESVKDYKQRLNKGGK